jgi:hypothetical protein
MHLLFTTASGAVMRTTFTLDDDAAELARKYARANGVRLGQAVSELIRRASTRKPRIRPKGEFWVFDLPPDAPKVTAQQVKAAMEDWP